MALETLRSMIDEQEVLARETAPEGTTMTALAREVRRSFQFQSTILKCLHLRSKAVEERLRNETNLVLLESFPHSYTENKANACKQAFNMVSQYDSRIQVRIGEATQSDSTAMKMVSFLGFLFLPGTFVSVCPPSSFFVFLKTGPLRKLTPDRPSSARASSTSHLEAEINRRVGPCQRNSGSTGSRRYRRPLW